MSTDSEMNTNSAGRSQVEETLRRAHDELEIRVQERTAELARANAALLAEITERKRAEEERERLLAKVEQERGRAEELAKTLQHERDILQTIMENTHAHLAYLDPQFNFVRVNSTYAHGSGHSKEALLGRNHFELFPNPENQSIFAKVRDTGQLVEYRAKPFEFVDQPERGITYWDWTLAPVKDAGGKVQGLVLSLTEVTERVRAEKQREEAHKQVERVNRTLKALSNSSQAMMRAVSEADYLNEVCRVIVEDCGHAMVWIGLAENDEQKSVRPVASAGFEAGYLDTLKITWADTERGRGPTGTAIRTGKPSRCRNMLTDPQFAPWLEEAIKRGYASSIVVPLVIEEQTMGAISIYSKEPDPFSEAEEKLLTELAGDLAYGIATIRLQAAHERAEAALRQSEERYRTLFDSMNEGFALHEIICNQSGNPCDYRFLEMNASFERLTGLNREATMGKTVKDVLPGIENSWIETYGRVALTGEPIHFENFSNPLDRHYEVYAYRPAPRQFAALFMDITERKLAEDILRQARDELEQRVQERTRELSAANRQLQVERQRFNDVLEMLPAYLVLLTPDYHVSLANRFFRERFGESHGRHCYEYLFGRTEPCEICETYRVLKTKEPHHWEWTGPDGRNYDIFDFPFTDTDGSTLILEMGIDVTERKQAQAELEEYRQHLEELVEERTAQLAAANARLQAEIAERQRAEVELQNERTNLQMIFDVVNVGMLLIEPGGCVKRVNNVVAHWTGKRPREMHGLQPGDALGCIHVLNEPGRCGRTPHCQACRIRNAFEAVLRSGQPVHDVEVESTLHLRGEKTRLWLKISVDPLEVDGRRHAILALNNITALKEVERALVQARDELEMRVRERTLELTHTNEALEAEIAERTVVEERLRVSEQRFRTLVESVADTVYTLDRHQRYKEIFGSWFEMTGLTRNQVLGKTTSEVLGADAGVAHEDANWRVFGGEHVIYEWSIASQPMAVHFQNSLSPLYDAAGNVNGIVGIMRNVTKQKHLEKQLIQAEKLMTAAEMSAMISHEFRNSLTSIRMILELQLESSDLKTSQSKPLKVALGALGHMESIVTQLLSFTRPAPMLFRPASLNEVVEKSLGFVNPQFLKADIRIKKKLDPSMPVVKLDDQHLGEALINLFLNAVQALAGNDLTNRREISIATRKHIIQQTLHDFTFTKVSEALGGEHLPQKASELLLPLGTSCALIEIWDTGPGIDPKNLNRIFDLFFTTKTSGTGLGLAMVKRTVNAHGGIVKVRSKLGKGTTFSIYLPLDQTLLGQ